MKSSTKKQSSSNKLKLHHETLRRLTRDELPQAVGGKLDPETGSDTCGNCGWESNK